jgi:hypothetical protein
LRAARAGLGSGISGPIAARTPSNVISMLTWKPLTKIRASAEPWSA